MKISRTKSWRSSAEIVSDTIHTLNELGIDQDYAAYLLLSAGMGLAITGNRKSPIITTQILAAAMMVANQNIIGTWRRMTMMNQISLMICKCRWTQVAVPRCSGNLSLEQSDG